MPQQRRAVYECSLATMSLLIAPWLAACSPAERPEIDQPGVRQGAVVTFGALEGTDVTGVRIDVSECGEPPFASELVPLSGAAPGGSLELLDAYSDESGHALSAFAMPLDVGCYRVRGNPVQADESPSEDCSPTRNQQFSVGEGELAEVALLSQCAGDEAGYVDAGVVFNQAPSLVVESGTRITEQCEPLEICVAVSDPDADPVSLAWSSPGATVEPDAELVADGEGWVQCARVSSANPGDVTVTVVAHDLDVNGQPIEDLPAFPNGEESHVSADIEVDVLPGDGCILVLDDFERPDSIDVGVSIVPGNAWVEEEFAYGAGPTNIALEAGAVRVQHPGTLSMSVDQGETFALERMRIRAQISRVGQQAITIATNADGLVSGTGFLWANSPPFNDQRIRVYEGQGQGLGDGLLLATDGTEYFVEVDIDFPDATLAVATGGYPGDDGATLVGSEAVTLTALPQGQLTVVYFSDSTDPGTQRLEELEIIRQ